MRKKYINQTCAYCGREGMSTTRDHVVSKEFFLPRDRGNLPVVPACKKCNGDKSILERYALTILPLASRHVDAKEYSVANIKRRLRKNPALRNKIFVEPTGIWERLPNGLLVPVASVAFDQEKFRRLFALIVRGLFTHHWGEVLEPEWQPDVAIITAERAAFPNIINILGPNFVAASGNLGRGTLTYEGIRSVAHKWNSLWQLTWFGRIPFGSDADTANRSFTKLSALTVRRQHLQTQST